MNKKKLIWQLPFLVVLIVGTVIILKKQPPFRTDEGFIFRYIAQNKGNRCKACNCN